MTTVLIIVNILLFVLLLVVASIAPRRSSLSKFEFDRRVKQNDSEARRLLQREELLYDVLSLQRVKVAVLLVLFVISAIGAYGWLLGVVVAVVVALEYSAAARLSFIHRPAQRLYEKYEPSMLKVLQKHPGVFKVIRGLTPEPPADKRLDSRDELRHLVSEAAGLLTADEKKRILHSLDFPARRVSEIMTPRGMIDSINRKELLGPLVLSDLHKTGHSRFPVTEGDIDHVVGMLYIQDLLVVDSGKRSSTVDKSMSPRVFYIREDQTLDHALAAFIRTRHHLFIVINEFRETVGVLSLEDVMEALLGHKIVDEFDAHEDLRTVAARNVRKNNQPANRRDI